MDSRQLHFSNDGSMTVAETSDCSNLIKVCKGLQSADMTGSKDFKLAASFDPVVVVDWCKKRGITFQEWCADNKFVREMLNDPELAHFRIWKGRA